LEKNELIEKKFSLLEIEKRLDQKIAALQDQFVMEFNPNSVYSSQFKISSDRKTITKQGNNSFHSIYST